MEITANGEARPLTRRVNTSSNSLDKSAASLCKSGFSAEGCGSAAKGEGDGGKRCGNQYDNIPEIRANGVVVGGGDEGKGEGEEKEKWRKSSAASVCCNSEFVEFIDTMDERRGSLRSLMRYIP